MAKVEGTKQEEAGSGAPKLSPMDIAVLAVALGAKTVRVMFKDDNDPDPDAPGGSGSSSPGTGSESINTSDFAFDVALVLLVMSWFAYRFGPRFIRN